MTSFHPSKTYKSLEEQVYFFEEIQKNLHVDKSFLPLNFLKTFIKFGNFEHVLKVSDKILTIKKVN